LPPISFFFCFRAFSISFLLQSFQTVPGCSHFVFPGVMRKGFPSSTFFLGLTFLRPFPFFQFFFSKESSLFSFALRVCAYPCQFYLAPAILDPLLPQESSTLVVPYLHRLVRTASFSFGLFVRGCLYVCIEFFFPSRRIPFLSFLCFEI